VDEEQKQITLMHIREVITNLGLLPDELVLSLGVTTEELLDLLGEDILTSRGKIFLDTEYEVDYDDYDEYEEFEISEEEDTSA
jgi:hypothetical protein